MQHAAKSSSTTVVVNALSMLAACKRECKSRFAEPSSIATMLEGLISCSKTGPYLEVEKFATLRDVPKVKMKGETDNYYVPSRDPSKATSAGQMFNGSGGSNHLADYPFMITTVKLLIASDRSFKDTLLGVFQP